MKAKFKWEDLFNHELLVQKGEYCFHRFYHDPDKAVTITTVNKTDRLYPKPANLMHLKPIAIGITGFLIFEREENYFTSLKSKLEKNIDFCTEDIYKEYFEHCLKFEQRRNKKLPNPASSERAEKLFIPVHIREEELKFEESKKFYEEFNIPKEEKIILKLKEYASGYIKWLDDLNTNPEFKNDIYTLEMACRGTEEFQSIKKWFIVNGYCDSSTFIWKDKGSGNKSLLASYLKDLYIKNYTSELNSEAIQKIAINSFGLKIGISTIDHSKADNNSKIPSFSSI